MGSAVVQCSAVQSRLQKRELKDIRYCQSPIIVLDLDEGIAPKERSVDGGGRDVCEVRIRCIR